MRKIDQHPPKGQLPQPQEPPNGPPPHAAKLFPPTEKGSAAGILRPEDGRTRSIKEMNQAIEHEVRARHARGRY